MTRKQKIEIVKWLGYSCETFSERAGKHYLIVRDNTTYAESYHSAGDAWSELLKSKRPWPLFGECIEALKERGYGHRIVGMALVARCSLFHTDTPETVLASAEAADDPAALFAAIEKLIDSEK